MYIYHVLMMNNEVIEIAADSPEMAERQAELQTGEIAVIANDIA